jgi:hypothetical protein
MKIIKSAETIRLLTIRDEVRRDEVRTVGAKNDQSCCKATRD